MCEICHGKGVTYHHNGIGYVIKPCGCKPLPTEEENRQWFEDYKKKIREGISK